MLPKRCTGFAPIHDELFALSPQVAKHVARQIHKINTLLVCVCGILLSSCRWLGWVNRFPVAHAQDRQEKGVVWLQYNYGHMGRQIERKIATATVIARWHLRAKTGSRLAELRSTNEVLYKFACSCCCWWQWREKLRTEAKAAQNSALRSALSLPPFLPLCLPLTLSLLPLVTLGVLCLGDASV